jgi:hypothetical protein
MNAPFVKTRDLIWEAETPASNFTYQRLPEVISKMRELLGSGIRVETKYAYNNKTELTFYCKLIFKTFSDEAQAQFYFGAEL